MQLLGSQEDSENSTILNQIYYVGTSLIGNFIPFFDSVSIFAVADELDEPFIKSSNIIIDISLLFVGGLIHFAHVLIREPHNFKKRKIINLTDSSEPPSTFSGRFFFSFQIKH